MYIIFKHMHRFGNDQLCDACVDVTYGPRSRKREGECIMKGCDVLYGTVCKSQITGGFPSDEIEIDWIS
jgi:hypothetical protein